VESGGFSRGILRLVAIVKGQEAGTAKGAIYDSSRSVLISCLTNTSTWRQIFFLYLGGFVTAIGKIKLI